MLLYSKIQEEKNKLKEELLKEPGLDDLGNSYPDPVGKKIVSQYDREKKHEGVTEQLFAKNLLKTKGPSI